VPSRQVSRVGLAVALALAASAPTRAFAQQTPDVAVLERDGSFAYRIFYDTKPTDASRSLSDAHAEGCSLRWDIVASTGGVRTQSTATLTAVDPSSLTVTDLDSAGPTNHISHQPHFWQVEFRTRDGSSPVVAHNSRTDTSRPLPAIVFLASSQAAARRIGAVVAALVNRCQHS
jgi:hypothetical protein